jgi:hypothetical protein
MLFLLTFSLGSYVPCLQVIPVVAPVLGPVTGETYATAVVQSTDEITEALKKCFLGEKHLFPPLSSLTIYKDLKSSTTQEALVLNQAVFHAYLDHAKSSVELVAKGLTRRLEIPLFSKLTASGCAGHDGL